MTKEERKKWVIHLNGECHTIEGDCDGHLKLWISHEDGTPVHPMSMGMDRDNEWGDFFTTEGIEKEYRESGDPNYEPNNKPKKTNE